MSTHFVYLHIPKSAGTSQRALLHKNYGKSSVFWYGIDGTGRKFDSREIDPFPVVGGHRHRKFFEDDRIDCFFSAVVREPVSRAISLFNFYATHPKGPRSSWISKGLQPASMLQTIKRCPEFVAQIQNMQCRYLSAAPTFCTVQAALGEVPCVVGVFDDLNTYNATLAAMFGWHTTAMPRVWCGPPRYEKAIREEPGLVAAVERLNREDSQLYDWLRGRGVLVNDRDLAKYQSCLRAPPRTTPAHFTADDVQRVRLSVADSTFSAAPGTLVEINLRIENGSNRVLHCGGPNPIIASYHLLDGKGERRPQTGLRTRLKRDIGPGQVDQVPIQVKIPGRVGGTICQAQAGLLQLRVMWFESLWPEHGCRVTCHLQRGEAA